MTPFAFTLQSPPSAPTSLGPTFLFAPMPASRTFSLGVFIPTGSLHEAPNEHGIAHLIEHMLFKGTPTRNALTIARQPEQSGAHLNAFTSHDSTGYFIEGLPSHAAQHLDLLLDLVQNPLFSPSELMKEKEVVTQEILMYQDDPQTLVSEQLLAAAFGTHPMGYSITGTVESVSAFTANDLRSFHTRHYTPDRLIIACAGPMDLPAFQAMIAHAFGVSPSALVAPETLPPSPTHPSSPFTPHTALQYRSIDQTHVALGWPAPSRQDPLSYWTEHLAVAALGHGMSSPLFQSLRENQGLAYDLLLHLESNSQQGLITFESATQPAQVKTLLSSFSTLLHHAPTQVTSEDLSRALHMTLFALSQEQEHPLSTLQSLTDHWMTSHQLLSLDALTALLSSISLPSIHACYQRWLQSTPALSIVTAPSQRKRFSSSFLQSFQQPFLEWPHP